MGRDAVVDEFNFGFSCQQDVVSFDIAVHAMIAMQVNQSL